MALTHRNIGSPGHSLAGALALIAVVLSVGCGGGSPSAPTPTPAPTPPANCSFTVGDAPAGPIAHAGAEFTVAVTTAAGCAWSAVSGSPFITTMGTPSGSGAGTARFKVEANAGGARQGTVQVADRTLNVTQAANDNAPAPPACSFDVNPGDLSVAPAGGDITVNVSVASGTNCAWTATANDAFIAVKSGASGVGAGAVVLTIAPHTGADGRSGTATIAGRSVAIVQAGTGAPCSLTVSPLTFNLDHTTRHLEFTITQTQGANCPWIARVNAEWMNFNGGWSQQSGTGTATVQFRAGGNVGPARTGTISVAGQTISVTQAASPPPVPCAYAVSPLTQSLPYEGGWAQVRVDVTQGENCVWSVTFADPWLTLYDFTHVGPKVLTVIVQPNSFSARKGSLTAAGKTVTIEQAAHPGDCQFRIDPNPLSVGASMSQVFGYVRPIVGQHCGYTSQASASWLRLEPASGQIPQVGYQPVLIWVDPNTGAGRTGTITVGNAVLTVTQAAALPANAAAVISVTGDAGEYVSQGQSITRTLVGSQFSLTLDQSTNSVNVGSADVSLSLAPPIGVPLAPGYFPVAFRFPGVTGAGVSVSMGSRACNQVTGRLLIHEVVLAPGNTIQRFHARFEQHCEGQVPALRGTIWVDAAGSTTPPAIPPFPALPATLVTGLFRLP